LKRASPAEAAIQTEPPFYNVANKSGEDTSFFINRGLNRPKGAKRSDDVDSLAAVAGTSRKEEKNVFLYWLTKYTPAEKTGSTDPQKTPKIAD
jgi:hypothetical protein